MKKMMTNTLAMIILTVPCVYGQGRNLAVGSNGMIIGTFSPGPLSVRLADGTIATQTIPANELVFDDVSIDGDLVFGLSTASQNICSFVVDTLGVLTSTANGCAGEDLSVSPFSGISASGGNVLVSGGTGGLSFFTYDNAGLLTQVLTNEVQDNVVGLPDVIMLSPDLAAFSTDFAGSTDGSQRFGNLIASVSGTEITRVRDFRIAGTQFQNTIGPANFPLVNAVFTSADGSMFLYTANGVLTVVDPTADGVVTEIAGAPANFQAVTVAINSAGSRAYFGGLLDGNSMVVEFDITQPMIPVSVGTTNVAGRITSIAVADDVVTFTIAGGTSIQTLPTAAPDTATAGRNTPVVVSAGAESATECPDPSPAP